MMKTPKVIATKAKIDKWYLITVMSFCTEKETINSLTRQHTEGEKSFVNYASNKVKYLASIRSLRAGRGGSSL